jgi:hypothetical protein
MSSGWGGNMSGTRRSNMCARARPARPWRSRCTPSCGVERCPRLGRPGLDHALNVHTPERGDALVSVVDAESLEELPTRSTRGFGELGERGRCEVAGDRRGHRARPRAARPQIGARGPCSPLVGGHELVRIGEAGQGRPLEARTPEVVAGLAVTIDKAVNVGWKLQSHSFASA